ncbi:4-hydroxybenzoate polyprenyltransferase [Asanoa hainanensis]|uniref:4-hydroxybenzoate polyprenyltransferase n=1 Tax=Asanoa hainanensis TaxID=560556 RepID=A0A239H5K3_9ACTN|nr:UbiA family prenyltransferase [Asanoa hainanensis]SNS76451.1 4-hydroxybenzoate polyprenyltransferase [Asanoa hainanensis]
MAEQRTWHPAVAVLKISKVPFWFIWVTPFTFAYLASAPEGGSTHLWWFVVSVAGICLVESANCIHNELVDHEEDAANQPRRPSLVRSVGEPVLWRTAVGGYLVSLCGAIATGVLVNPVVAVMMLAAWLAAPIYNWGLRLKRRPGWAELDIAWATLFGYLAGWTWHQPLSTVPAVVWLVTFFFGVSALLKDLPDVVGDESVGAPGVFSLRNRFTRRVALTVIAGSPYLVLLALTATGQLPPRMLALAALSVIGAAVMVLGERAHTLETFILAYELAFSYVHLFMLVLFVLYSPGLLAVTVALCLLAGRTLALALQLAPRFAEPSFTWSGSWRVLTNATVS